MEKRIMASKTTKKMNTTIFVQHASVRLKKGGKR
nr:MAG TPA: hypothetical protein [Caudoviricetes sp.]